MQLRKFNGEDFDLWPGVETEKPWVAEGGRLTAIIDGDTLEAQVSEDEDGDFTVYVLKGRFLGLVWLVENLSEGQLINLIPKLGEIA